MTLRPGLNVTVLALLAVIISVSVGETYRLTNQQGWQNIADSPEGEYLLAVSKIKQQLLTGDESDVVAALEDLKKRFPEIAGAEVDAYLAAETLYADEKWYKAATAYKQFTDSWPVSILQPAAMERLYSIATAYLQGQKRRFFKILNLPAHDTGVELMRDVADKAGNSPLGLRALTTLAESYESRKELMDAYYIWQEVADRWPTGETRKKAVLRMAQTLHASYEGAQYDATVLDSAQTYFEDYLAQYPEDAARLEVSKTLELITEQLAYKEYQMGFYYERTGKSDAANKYYRKVVDTWPDSKAAQMAQARMAPDAVSPVQMNTRRRVVNGVTRFLDSWYGIDSLFDKVLPADGDFEKDLEMSPDFLDEGI